ncbi:MAG: hypothetical protein J5J06_08145 [Phycisphaerae bacterium]|nr:hypothetical protein [Phycisphaerae bacterium]
MTEEASKSQLLQIKKYPNRRYYDTTRSCHVTLHEVYDLVRAGHDVCITDSRTNQDITSLVLLQVLLDRDPPKLDLFPSALIHQAIRANLPVLQSTIEQFFGPFMTVLATSQKQFDVYLRQAISGAAVNPAEWAGRMMSLFATTPAASNNGKKEETTSTSGSESEADTYAQELAELRRQLNELTKRVGGLGNPQRPESGNPA